MATSSTFTTGPEAESTVGRHFAIAHSVPGRLRLRLHPPHTRARLEAAGAALTPAPAVRGVRLNASAWSLVVEYDPARTTPESLLAVCLDGALPTTAAFPDAVEASAVIAAPPAQVWRLLTDPEHVALLAPGTVRVHGAVETDRWSAEVEVLGKRVTLQVHVLERDAARRLVLGLADTLRARLTVTIEEEAGGTRLRERLDYALPGKFLGRLLSRVAARPRLQRELKEHLTRISSAAEQPPAPGQA